MGVGVGLSRQGDTTAITNLSGGTYTHHERYLPLSAPNTVGVTTNVSVPASVGTLIDESETQSRVPLINTS